MSADTNSMGSAPNIIASVVPNTLVNVPGSTDAYNRHSAVMTAIANLPLIFFDVVDDLCARNQKIVYMLDAVQVTNPADVLMLQAMAKVVEAASGYRAYVHLSCALLQYRIGPLYDDDDQAYVRGWLVMGRFHDSLVADPNGDYLRANGVPANFATFNGTLSLLPARPSYPVAPYLNKKGKLVTKTSKPRNAWIIYRASRHAIVKAENPKLHTSHISSIIKEEWSMMDAELKVLYNEMAQNEKLVHLQNYPDFELKPRKSEEIRRRRPAGVMHRVTAVAPIEVWESTH